jgi:hypothetical protein
MNKKIEQSFQYILAGLIVIGFFTAIIVFMVCEIPVSNAGAINLLVGSLISSFSLIVGYFWGSSAGSKNKDEIIANSKNNEVNKPI